MSIPISQFIPPLAFPPGNHKFVLYICDLKCSTIFFDPPPRVMRIKTKINK